MYADAATRCSWSPKCCQLNPYILCRRRYPSKAYTGVSNTWDVDRVKRRQHGSNDDNYRDVAPAAGDAALAPDCHQSDDQREESPPRRAAGRGVLASRATL